MSVHAMQSTKSDPVLALLPAAAWRALPVLATAGFLVAAVVVLAGLVTAVAPWSFPLVVSVCAGPLLAWAGSAVHTELFESPTPVRPLRRVLFVTGATTGFGVLVTWSMFAAAVAEAAHSWPFQVVAVAAVLLAVVWAAIAVVALPLGCRRSDVSVRTILMLSLLAVVRRPVAAVAALAATAAVTWLGLTWFAGVLILVAPVLVVLMVGAAWATATSFGVDLPELASRTRRRDETTGGAR